MATKKKSKSKSVKLARPASSIVWFEIPADNTERAKNFYGALFGWKMNKMPGPMDYWHMDTRGADASPDGGLMARQNPEHRGITNFISVASVTKSSAQVEKLGGKICMIKTAVPQMGYFAVCQDTENNKFGLWETDSNAK